MRFGHNHGSLCYLIEQSMPSLVFWTVRSRNTLSYCCFICISTRTTSGNRSDQQLCEQLHPGRSIVHLHSNFSSTVAFRVRVQNTCIGCAAERLSQISSNRPPDSSRTCQPTFAKGCPHLDASKLLHNATTRLALRLEVQEKGSHFFIYGRVDRLQHQHAACLRLKAGVLHSRNL